MHTIAKERLEILINDIETVPSPYDSREAEARLLGWMHELAEIVQLLCQPDGMPRINNGETE